ncbi:hypothetical protein ARALYDRAFT_493282, partial [Arabidopsis lyrata subsp. lyrata]
MAMAQKDRNRWVAQKEMIDKPLPYRFSPETTIEEPVVSHPAKPIHFFGGAHPSDGNPNPFERPKGRRITCDEAVRLYGGVLI